MEGLGEVIIINIMTKKQFLSLTITLALTATLVAQSQRANPRRDTTHGRDAIYPASTSSSPIGSEAPSISPSFGGGRGEAVLKSPFGGAAYDFFKAVTTVADGYVAVGRSSSGSFGTGDWIGAEPKGEWEDAIIVKFNESGNPVWQKNFGGGDYAWYDEVIQVANGVIAVGGVEWEEEIPSEYEGLTPKGEWGDAIIVKYDNNGNIVWKKNFGGNGWQHFISSTTVSDGIIVVGAVSAASFGNGDLEGLTAKGSNYDAIIVKYDNSGNIVWIKNFGGSTWQSFISVITVSDGIIVTGIVDTSSFGSGDLEDLTGKGGDDALIVKYDFNGNVIWKNSFGGAHQDVFASVTAVSDGLVVAGRAYYTSFGNGDWEGIPSKGTWYDGIVLKYDYSGNLVWKKNFGGINGDFFYGIATVADGVIAVGCTYPVSFGTGDWAGVTGKGSVDATAVKFDNSGNVIWKDNFGGNDFDWFNGVFATSNGIVAVGWANEPSFGNGDWTGIEGRGGECAAIIVKYDFDTPPAPPTITTTMLPNGEANVSYTAYLSATGSTPITWEITTGTLPTGLSLAQNTGVISGIPTASGDFNFTVKATNEHGNDTKGFSITITPPVVYVVNVYANPEEGGTVDGAGEYNYGSTATVTATPKDGFIFLNWTIEDVVITSANPYIFTVIKDVDFVANFIDEEEVTFLVTVLVNNDDYGYVTGGGLYNENATATLTAHPNSHHQFVNWTIDGEEISTHNPYNFTVTEDVEIVANFGTTNVDQLGIKNYELRIYPNPTNGQLTISPAGRGKGVDVRAEYFPPIQNVEIYDMTGRPVFISPSFGGGRGEVDISHLPAGIYMLKIENQTFKITKK